MPKHSSDVVTIHPDMWEEALESIQTSYRFNPRLSRGDIQGTRHRTHRPSLWGPESRLVVTTILPTKTVPKQKIWKTQAQHVSTTMFRQDSTWMIAEALKPRFKMMGWNLRISLKIKLRGTPCHFELKPSRQNPRLPGPNGSPWPSYPSVTPRVTIDKSSFLHSST